MPDTHLAAAIENGINRRLVPILRARGWHPRTLPYVGYGNQDFVRILGRVLLTRGHEPLSEAEQPVEEDLTSRRGWRSYVTASVGYMPITVRVGDRDYPATADRGGYLDVVISDHGLTPGWHDVTITAKAAAPVTERVQIIDAGARFGIISDIDDTALVTLVPRPFIAVWNTFIRHGSARKVVPGMAQMYRDLLAEHPGAPIFYLSTGAWNIMPTLVQFLRGHRFPAGTMLMTDWGPTNSGWFRSGQEHKRHALRRLTAEFPHIRWVLVGDDGQHDPYLYREFAQEFPSRVAVIAIRELTPGEQVLAHGSPMPVQEAGTARRAGSAAEVGGGDGTSLAPKLKAALRQP
jgi:phosphatidate phosphatase APP1